MMMNTIYTKIWDTLKIADVAGLPVSFNRHEAETLFAWLRDYEESKALLKSDYQQTIATLQAEVERLRKANARYENLMDWLEAVDFESISRAVELAKIARLEDEYPDATPDIPEQIRRWEEGEGQ